MPFQSGCLIWRNVHRFLLLYWSYKYLFEWCKAQKFFSINYSFLNNIEMLEWICIHVVLITLTWLNIGSICHASNEFTIAEFVILNLNGHHILTTHLCKDPQIFAFLGSLNEMFCRYLLALNKWNNLSQSCGSICLPLYSLANDALCWKNMSCFCGGHTRP